MPLHLTKVAYGAQSVEEVLGWWRERGDEYRHVTRHRPKRAEEIVGGSLYWIVKHRLVARTPILGFEEAEGGRTAIVLSTAVRPVVPVTKRAHQGWRYLSPSDAPPDLDAHLAPGELPPTLVAELAGLGLL